MESQTVSGNGLSSMLVVFSEKSEVVVHLGKNLKQVRLQAKKVHGNGLSLMPMMVSIGEEVT